MTVGWTLVVDGPRRHLWTGRPGCIERAEGYREERACGRIGFVLV